MYKDNKFDAAEIKDGTKSYLTTLDPDQEIKVEIHLLDAKDATKAPMQFVNNGGQITILWHLHPSAVEKSMPGEQKSWNYTNLWLQPPSGTDFNSAESLSGPLNKPTFIVIGTYRQGKVFFYDDSRKVRLTIPFNIFKKPLPKPKD